MGPVRRGARLEGGDERESQRACPLWPRMRRACYLAQDQHPEGTDAERHGKRALPLDCHDLPLLGHEPLYGISERSSARANAPPRQRPHSIAQGRLARSASAESVPFAYERDSADHWATAAGTYPCT